MTEPRQVRQPAIAAVLVAIAAGTALAFIGTLRIHSNASLVAHTVKSVLAETLGAITDAETGQRGFIITGDASYLEPYSAGTSNVQRTLATLDSLTRDDARQQALLSRLRLEVAQRLQELSHSIQVRQAEGFEAGQQIVRTNVGQARMDRIRRIVADMNREEDRLLEVRGNASAVGLRVAIAFELTTALMAFGLVGVAARASRNRRGEASARDQLARRLAAIVESSDDAIVGKDLTGTVTSWNSSATRIFGFSATDMIGQSIRTIIPPDRQGEEDQVLDRVGRGESVAHFETIRLRQDGSSVPISLTVSPIRDDDGRVIGASKIARDISERRHAEAALNSAILDAERANRLKDEFLATLSHELRTPLNAVLGYARMLRAGSIGIERQARALEVLERNATSLSTIVEDILDVSRIIAGKTRLHMQPVEPAAVIDQAIATIRPAAEAKGVQLQTEVDRRLPPISGDPDRLQQVIWNLLANAVKFTASRGRVEIRLARLDSEIEIIVSDTGIGIPPEFLPHVFDRFRQADSGFSRRHGGLGLGLAICRHLVELHGGLISAASDGDGKGATFRVTLPTRQADRLSDAGLPHLPSETDANDPTPGRLDGVHVLAVDNDDDA
jgi:PAS domain S-box-containing protein